MHLQVKMEKADTCLLKAPHMMRPLLAGLINSKNISLLRILKEEPQLKRLLMQLTKQHF